MSLDLSGRIALVTGASRGIGYFTALELAKAGAHVIACARTVGGLEDLDDAIKAAGGQPATLVPFDLDDMDAIDRLGASIHERWGRLDILVANAGILGTISPIGHIDPKDFERVMRINVVSTWRLIGSVEPLLKASDAGRAVVLSSGAAHRCRPFWGAYSASKAAVEALVRTWAAEIENISNVRVLAVDPGVTRTQMRAKAAPGEDPNSIPHPSEVAAVIAPLTAPSQTETGRLYVVREKAFKDFRAPE
ncbi:SDR family NAD(P)-dependent oxidoreductase [Rhizobiaceae bacterium BDR2-2]|uniref:SDR family NAD(P)-dependent oxidoreductase n=1 Tax=Ectorhizobium quercum TaxID=2965071 RepID=A0AAE3SXH9_9HYPH|nr:SDR family NAD(P)-dependent oxidoreductase [Ectorhizobium quercum]MCX8999054.1 SDR family NAD(P)-dependent oxidoreductase [Ectorhizobium quercum]